MKTTFIALFCSVAAFLVGMESGWRQREAEPDKIVTLTRTCPEPVRMTPRWDCATAEAKTYCSTCLRRKWL